MSTTGFVFENLRDDREKEIYLEAFWEGVRAGDSLLEEMCELGDEWRIGRKENSKTPIQQSAGEVR